MSVKDMIGMQLRHSSVSYSDALGGVKGYPVGKIPKFDALFDTPSSYRIFKDKGD